LVHKEDKVIAKWAKDNGYNGIKYYGARGGSARYTNYVIFKDALNDTFKNFKDVKW